MYLFQDAILPNDVIQLIMSFRDNYEYKFECTNKYIEHLKLIGEKLHNETMDIKHDIGQYGIYCPCDSGEDEYYPENNYDDIDYIKWGFKCITSQNVSTKNYNVSEDVLIDLDKYTNNIDFMYKFIENSKGRQFSPYFYDHFHKSIPWTLVMSNNYINRIIFVKHLMYKNYRYIFNNPYLDIDFIINIFNIIGLKYISTKYRKFNKKELVQLILNFIIKPKRKKHSINKCNINKCDYCYTDSIIQTGCLQLDWKKIGTNNVKIDTDNWKNIFISKCKLFSIEELSKLEKCEFIETLNNNLLKKIYKIFDWKHILKYRQFSTKELYLLEKYIYVFDKYIYKQYGLDNYLTMKYYKTFDIFFYIYNNKKYKFINMHTLCTILEYNDKYLKYFDKKIITNILLKYWYCNKENMEKIFDRFEKYICFYTLSRYKICLTEKMYEKYENDLYWDYISANHILTDKLIYRFRFKIDFYILNKFNTVKYNNNFYIMINEKYSKYNVNNNYWKQ